MDRIKKIAEWMKNTNNVSFTLAWAVRIFILLMLMRLTFFNNSEYNTLVEKIDERNQKIVVVDYKITMLEKQDSTYKFVIDEHRKSTNLDTLDAAAIHKHITDIINKP
jgi:flagellar biosynthesis/type III secretory pathway M-ring protein FliF/YscJ